MDLRRQLAVTRTWLPLLVVSVVLAAGAAFLISNLQQKVYQAKATLIVGQSLTGVNPDYNQLLASQRLSATYAAVATTRPIAAAVIDRLKLDVSPDDLLKRLVAEAPTDSTLVKLSAQDPDPARAAAIANALAEELIAASPAIQGRQADIQTSIDADLRATQVQIDSTQQRQATLAALPLRTPEQEAELGAVEGRLVSLRSTYATLLSFSSGNASNLLSVVEPAIAPIDPVSPRPVLNALLAAVLGLLIAAAVAFGAEALSDTVKDADDVLEVSGMGTLGSIARMKGEAGRGEMYQLAALLYPRSSIAEGYRTLRTNIEFASVDNPLKTLLITSALPSEGKTITAANLAVVFAQAGRPVLLVDADLRRPGVHDIFGLTNAHGLTTLLRSDEVSLDAIAQDTEQDNLRVLTTGPLPPNPAELLGSQRMSTILERLKAGGELLIFDSPPLQPVADSAILASYLDGTIFVVDVRHSRRRAVRAGAETLARAGAHVLGAVLNRLPARADSGDSDYHYYGTLAPADARPPATDDHRR